MKEFFLALACFGVLVLVGLIPITVVGVPVGLVLAKILDVKHGLFLHIGLGLVVCLGVWLWIKRYL